jgi:hypothetical protein
MIQHLDQRAKVPTAAEVASLESQIATLGKALFRMKMAREGRLDRTELIRKLRFSARDRILEVTERLRCTRQLAETMPGREPHPVPR